MKKIILSMLAMAALVSCTENTNDASVNPDLTPITLTGGVMQVEVGTKAPISTGNIDISVAGWASNTDFTTAAWETSAADFAVTETGAAIALATPQYYNPDGAISTYIRAWYPKTTTALVAGIASFENTTGDVDVMVSDLASGTKSTPAGALTFEHMTTQLIFNVVKNATLTGDVKIKSIAVKGTQLPTGFDFTKAGDEMVTYGAEADLPVPAITEASITTTAAVAGSPVMVKTPAGTTINLSIVAGGVTYDATATVPATFAKGTAYTITITFNAKEVEATAKVTAWKTSTGSAEVI